jgi:carboxypeptidase Q
MKRIYASLRLIAATILSFILSLAAVAQRPVPASPQAYSPQLLAELRQLQQAALASDYAYNQVAHLCNNIGPRLSGSLQAAQAVDYVAAELRQLGLEVQLEKVMVPHWVRGVEAGELVEFKGQAPNTTQKIILTALGGSGSTPPEGVTAEVVVVNNFDELRALGRERIAGKIVLYNARYDKQMAAQGFAFEAYGQAVVYRSTGASEAARLGAVASLVRSVGSADYRLPHTGGLRYLDDAPRIPGGAVAAEDADLMAYLAAQGRLRMRLTMTPQTLADVESYNVIADVKGSEHPEQVVIVSGHLDSWDLGTGAIDDASGVAVAMQAVNLIKQLKLKPKRTIRVIAWMNEENGLRGGLAYAKDFAAQITNHLAAIESDSGPGHPTGISGHASNTAIEMLRPLAQILQSQGAGILRPSQTAQGADVSPLDAAGVSTWAPLQDVRKYFDYHHTAADTLDKVDPRELAENAAVIAALAYTIASLPEPLPR